MKKFTLALLLLFAAGMYKAKAQTATVSPSTICDGQLATFTVTYTPPSGRSVAKYLYNLYNTGTDIENNNNTYSFTYPPGTWTAKCGVKLDDGTILYTPTVNITVYNLPRVDMVITSQDTQCFRGNFFVFKNLSTQNPNSPSNPISFYYWNYGDAAGDTLYNLNDATHHYTAPVISITGMDVLLSATDSKGCRKDSLFKGIAAIKPNITPNFKWTFISGPCFVSCYQFKNTGTVAANNIMTYKWDFGEPPNSDFVGSGINDPDNHFDTITHCYRKDGMFNPALILTDLTGCIDSTRKKSNNTTQALPQNINFKFDIVTTKTATDTATRKDTVCSGSGNAKNVCFRMTPVSFAQGGAGDFVWNFGDPNDPNQKNLDSNSWNPCHLYSGMGTFFPAITIKNVCPDTTFIYRSVIETYNRMDSAAYPDNDWGANPTPPPGAQVLNFKFPDPIDFQDSINLTFTGTVRSVPQLLEGPADTNVYAYVTNPGNKLVFLQKRAPFYDVVGVDTIMKSTVRIPETHIFQFSKVPGGVKPLYHKYNGLGAGYDSIYSYQLEFSRPTVMFKKSAIITDTLTNKILDIAYIHYKLINTFKTVSYGVEVVGPSASIELPPAGIVVKASQKNQCGPTDTVDFVNTSSYFKSRKIWRRWDFDDNFAPQCTSFSVPRRGFPQPGPAGTWGTGAWTTAINQDYGSDHFFIANGVVYPGRMKCKFSFDTLPRYSYPNWDTVYKWYRQGHDFMPWDFTRWDSVTAGGGKSLVQPYDMPWWGKPVYLNIGTGEWSLTPGTTKMQWKVKSMPYTDPISGITVTRYFVDTIPTTDVPNTIDVPWPRIDTMNLKTNNSQDLNPGTPVQMLNIPDPIGLARGKYLVLTGPFLDPNNPINYIVKAKDGDSWTISANTPIPGGGDYYEYVFRRTIQRCLTVKQKLKDTVNNESYSPGGLYDSLILDDYDCFDEATVQLALSKADARGLAIGGKICPGLATNSFGANVRFSFQQLATYPGLVPSCGQTYVLFNYDSLADRKDLTPCDMDGWVTWQGGNTPGGLSRPPFFAQANFNPLSVWTSPAGTTFIYHYGFNSGTPPPADTANGWITVGLMIGNGCKDTLRKDVYMSQFRLNPAIYKAAIGTYAYNRFINIRPFPGDSLIDVEYVDCNTPRCYSTPVWYHNFLRIINLDAVFFDFPQQQTGAGIWKLRGKGDVITAFSEDSIQDSVKYDVWMWGDATVTVDSFWYAGDDTTNDGFYTNGVRRVRYNIDILNSGNAVIMDSTVWPIRASYPGATDGIKARTPGFFKKVSYDTLDYCTGLGKTNPSYIIVDTALMFLPITHKYVRTSWEADNRIDPYKGPDANISSMVRLIVSTAGCQQLASKLMTIGVIDTFFTKDATGHDDSVFCMNEPVYFHDSIRYWRYDVQVSSLPFFPGGTRNPVQGTLTYGFPENLMQIDTFNFWAYNEFYPLDFKGTFYDDKVILWNIAKGDFDTLVRHDSIFSERIYWDFGDGTWPFQMGRNPVHRYSGYGRYKVSMFSRDSMGFWDTCVRYVNIVKPVAKIGLVQSIFNCGIPAVPMWDSSNIEFGTGPSNTDNVYLQYWWFGDNALDTITPFIPATGNPQPQYPYRTNGKFKVKLVVQTMQGCYDTTYSEVFIKGPRPHFRVISDTSGCRPLVVTIVNMADSFDMQGPNDTPTRKTYINWGDGNQDFTWGRRDTLRHTYTDTGTYVLRAIGTDEDAGGNTICKPVMFPDSITDPPIRVIIADHPVDMEVSKHHVCVNETFTIQNNSNVDFTKFRYNFWRGPDSLNSVEQTGVPPNTVDHSFDSVGVYTIYGYPTGFSSSIPVASQANCARTDTMTVEVHKPYPAFNIDTVDYPTYRFGNTSALAYYYEWSLFKSDGSLLSSKLGNINDPHWQYDLKNDTGTYKVCLRALTYDTLGHCPDSVCHTINNYFVTNIFVPNVFSPDKDGVNDIFHIKIEGETKFELNIFNRWGDRVFESVDSKNEWNGTDKNDGSDCAAGVYYFVLNYKFRGKANTETKTGTVTLIR